MEAARVAQDLGIDGVFVFDHYVTRSRPGALAGNDPLALVGALCASTAEVAIGSLVYRSAAMPVGVSAHAFVTLAKLAGSRLIAGIGIGGRDFELEWREFGDSYPEQPARAEMTEKLADSLIASGVRTWIGGSGASAEEIASRSGAGLNLWGVDIESFGARAQRLTERGNEISWAGPWATSSPTGIGEQVLAHQFDSLKSNGASWAVIAPTGLERAGDIPAAYRRIRKCWLSAA